MPERAGAFSRRDDFRRRRQFPRNLHRRGFLLLFKQTQPSLKRLLEILLFALHGVEFLLQIHVLGQIGLQVFQRGFQQMIFPFDLILRRGEIVHFFPQRVVFFAQHDGTLMRFVF